MILQAISTYKLVRTTTVKNFIESSMKDSMNLFVSSDTEDFPIQAAINYDYISSLDDNHIMYIWEALAEEVIRVSTH